MFRGKHPILNFLIIFFLVIAIFGVLISSISPITFYELAINKGKQNDFFVKYYDEKGTIVINANIDYRPYTLQLIFIQDTGLWYKRFGPVLNLPFSVYNDDKKSLDVYFEVERGLPWKKELYGVCWGVIKDDSITNLRLYNNEYEPMIISINLDGKNYRIYYYVVENADERTFIGPIRYIY